MKHLTAVLFAWVWVDGSLPGTSSVPDGLAEAVSFIVELPLPSLLVRDGRGEVVSLGVEPLRELALCGGVGVETVSSDGDGATVRKAGCMTNLGVGVEDSQKVVILAWASECSKWPDSRSAR